MQGSRGPTNGGTDGDDSDIYEQASAEYEVRAMAFSKALFDHLHRLTETARVVAELLSEIDAPEAKQCAEKLRLAVAGNEGLIQAASSGSTGAFRENYVSLDVFRHGSRRLSGLNDTAKEVLEILSHIDAPETKQCAERLRVAIVGARETDASSSGSGTDL